MFAIYHADALYAFVSTRYQASQNRTTTTMPDYRSIWLPPSSENGTEVVIRPIRPADAGIEQDFVRGLSTIPQPLRLAQLRGWLACKLQYFTEIDYEQHMA
ncbi:MAG: hypothetical protein M5R42_05480 [Rhodocyclaceae bacterium]|nr:hypothetical protein [Rhodocyclaceae bacterium]